MTRHDPAPAGGHGVVLGALVAWLGAALLVGASGAMARLRPPGPQAVLLGLTLLLLIAARVVPPFRRFAARADLRWMVGFHLTRFVGFYFLYLHGRGELPPAFAVPAGWGDIVVAIGALLLVALVPPEGPTARRLYLAWNLLGFLDIAGVVLIAARLALADPASMGALVRLPLNVLLTYVVPIIIGTHIVMFGRLLGRPAEPPGAGR